MYLPEARQFDLRSLDSGFGSLSQKPSSVMQLRVLHQKLTHGISSIEDPRDFLTAMTYKFLIEDILRNFVGDDYVDSDFLRKVIRKLSASWRAAFDPVNSEHWIDALTHFASVYRNLPSARRTGETFTLEGIKFFWASGADPLYGPPEERRNQVDPTLRAFPNLDATLTDPRTSGRIAKWYVANLRRLVIERGVDTLCFIEKPFSTVGALGLLGYLVTDLQLPASIYRSAYWDRDARLSGTWPRRGATVALVYDVAIGGTALVEAAKYLSEEFEANATSALVVYDFERRARERLAERGIKLSAYRSVHDVESGLKRIHSLISILGERQAEFLERVFASGAVSSTDFQAESQESLDVLLSEYELALSSKQG